MESGEKRTESGERKEENGERRDESTAAEPGHLSTFNSHLSSFTQPLTIRINVNPVKAEKPQIQAEVKPMTQEDLERYWLEAGEKLELTEVLKNAEVHLGEKPGMVEIDAQTTWFAEEFKPHRIKVIEYLRERSGMRMLDCKVNPLFVGKDEVIYSPDQKYNAMLESNPQLSSLRRLFPQIDY